MTLSLHPVTFVSSVPCFELPNLLYPWQHVQHDLLLYFRLPRGHQKRPFRKRLQQLCSVILSTFLPPSCSKYVILARMSYWSFTEATMISSFLTFSLFCGTNWPSSKSLVILRPFPPDSTSRVQFARLSLVWKHRSFADFIKPSFTPFCKAKMFFILRCTGTSELCPSVCRCTRSCEADTALSMTCFKIWASGTSNFSKLCTSVGCCCVPSCGTNLTTSSTSLKI